MAEERRLESREGEHHKRRCAEAEGHELRPAPREDCDDAAGDKRQRPHQAGCLDQSTGEREKQCQRAVAGVAA